MNKIKKNNSYAPGNGKFRKKEDFLGGGGGGRMHLHSISRSNTNYYKNGLHLKLLTLNNVKC